MSAKDLSILIPARNEMFLSRTIEDILSHIEADTEVIAVLDGTWADPPIPQHDRVNVIYVPESIGQRAATNMACKLSKAKYVMKCDAHCSFDKGFDIKMLEAFKVTGDDVTMAPIMRNLWAFDWKCYNCGWKKYQGPTPEKCEQCGKSDKIRKKVVWIGKDNPQSTSYCFDSTPHFQYFNDYKKRPQYQKGKEEKGLTETMSLQGSCWMLTREKYWELNVCDENFGSWGSQGIEVACKTWLSGGQVLVNHNTWYAHMFRTQGGDFSFPYPISVKDQEKAKQYAKDLFFNNKWDKQLHPLSWLVEKFWPVKGWNQEDLQNLRENKFEFKGPTTAVKPEEVEPTPTKYDSEPVDTVTPTGTLTDNPLQNKAIPLEVQSFIQGLAEKGIIKVSEEKGGTTALVDLSVVNGKRGRPKKLFKDITIIGNSWLGKSVNSLFPDAYVYDPPKIGHKNRANQGEIAFICLPTQGKLDISIIEQCIAWCECPLIVIRSTVSPGTCDYLSKKYNKRIIMQPEYLEEDEKITPILVIGGNPEDRRKLIDLYAQVYKAPLKIRQVTALEAEVIKLTENRAIAFKIAQCQELYDVCEKAGVDYYTIRDVVYGDDPRFNLWWAFVNPNGIGANSNYTPSLLAWCAWAESLGINPEITRSVLESNKKWISQQTTD